MEKFIFKTLSLIIFGVVIIAAFYFLPWKKINWGIVSLSPSSTITVIGEAKSEISNQVASFTAGVTALGDNKEEAIKEVNTKVEKIIQALKDFGILEKDIKTSNLSVYQNEESYYDEEGRQKTRLGQWRISNNIEVKLKMVEKASELADLLTREGANNVYGPNFMTEDTKMAENELIASALQDARQKAGLMAQAAGKELGEVLNVLEGIQQYGNYRFFDGMGAGGGGGMPLEPGSSTVQKFLTVTFELK